MTPGRTIASGAAALIVASIVATPLGAQASPGLWLAARGGTLTQRSTDAAGPARLTGTQIGGEGRVWWNRLSLRLGYAEGPLGPPAGVRDQRHIEGFAFLGIVPLTGLELAGGPFIRAYVRGTTTERWLLWQLRARYAVPIVGAAVRGYAEGWSTMTGSVNAVERFNSGRGGAVGITLRVGAGPMAMRLGYAIDQARLGQGSRRETVEAVTFAVGYGRW